MAAIGGIARRAAAWLTGRGTLPAALVLFGSLVAGVVGRPWVLMQPDGSFYLALADSLRQGGGYAIGGMPHRGYPPGFPAMLAVARSAATETFAAVNLLIAGCGLGAIVACYWLISQNAGGLRRFALCLLVAASPAVLVFNGHLLSEIPFLLLMTLFLAAADAYWRRETAHWGLGLLAMVALAAAALTRLVGVSLYVAVAAWLARPNLWRLRRRQCAIFSILFAAIAVPPLAAWGLWMLTAGAGASGTYSDYVKVQFLAKQSPLSPEGFRMLVEMELETVPKQLQLFGAAVAAGLTGRSASAWALVPTALVLAGLARRLRAARPQEYCFIAYSLVTVGWPWTQGYRLWVPAVPLMLLYLTEGVELVAIGVGRLARLGEAKAAVLRRGALAAGGLVLFGASLSADYRIVKGFWKPPAAPINGVVLVGIRRDVALFLLENADRPLGVACASSLEVNPAVRNARGKAMAFPGLSKDDLDGGLRALFGREITHLAFSVRPDRLAWAPQETAAREFVEAHPEAFRLARETKAGRIFELVVQAKPL